MSVTGNKGDFVASDIKSFDFMYNDEKLFHVEVKNNVPIEQICYNKAYSLIAPIAQKYNTETLLRFFETRVFDRGRGDMDLLLNILDVPYYDAYLICRKTHGLLFTQRTWVRFEDEPNLTYAEAVRQLRMLGERANMF